MSEKIPEPRVKPTESFGENFPNLIFEAVVTDLGLQFEVYKAETFSICSRISHDNIVYIPGSVSQGLLQVVRFPPSSAEFGTPSELASLLTDFICKYGGVNVADACLMAAFAICTWFSDIFNTSPALYFTGPEERVHLAMRLLHCICHRSILLGHLNCLSLSTLPKQLYPTLLLHQKNLSKNVKRFL